MVKLVVEENIPRLRDWMQGAWKSDGQQAARLLERLMDFAAPRLARTEVEATVQRPISELTDDELAALVGGEVGDAALEPPETAREATAADVGVAPKPPEPAALPAPVPSPLASIALPPPARREEPAKAATPIEGELMPRYRTQAEREALEEERRERARADVRRGRTTAARAAVAEWDQKAAEYVAEVRRRRRDPNLTLTYSAIALAIGPRPPGPGL